MDLERIVQIYLKKFWPNEKRLLNWYKSLYSLESVIIHASQAHNEKIKVQSHQRRITTEAKSVVQKLLLASEQIISEASSFQQLYASLEKLIKPVRGIGDLYIYDASLRIGAYLNLEPEKVYLHCGTKIGAVALGINPHLTIVDKVIFPKEFQILEPLQIEDLLCIFKDEFNENESDYRKLRQCK